MEIAFTLCVSTTLIVSQSAWTLSMQLGLRECVTSVQLDSKWVVLLPVHASWHPRKCYACTVFDCSFHTGSSGRRWLAMTRLGTVHDARGKSILALLWASQLIVAKHVLVLLLAPSQGCNSSVLVEPDMCTTSSA
jgi:hypothetical protein